MHDLTRSAWTWNVWEDGKRVSWLLVVGLVVPPLRLLSIHSLAVSFRGILIISTSLAFYSKSDSTRVWQEDLNGFKE